MPLKESDNERVRELVSLDEQLLIDPGEMSPKAAAYFRERPWLTPDVAHKWRMGYLPNSAKGLLRGRVCDLLRGGRCFRGRLIARRPAR